MVNKKTRHSKKKIKKNKMIMQSSITKNKRKLTPSAFR